MKLSKRDLLKLLETATSKWSFFFDYLLYEQVDGFAMGSLLGPTLADAFLCHYEKECLYNCPIHFKPIAQKSYVDDVFFSSKEHLQRFVDYMNKQHKCQKLTFLDIKITLQKQILKTSVYRKLTFSGVFMHYESYLDQTYK